MKILLGTLVQWYEVELLSLYLESLQQSLDYTSKLDIAKDLEIHFDFYISDPANGLEKEIQDGRNRKQECLSILSKFQDKNPLCIIYVNSSEGLRNYESIAWYRRNLNKQGLESNYDFVVWGETDSLVPKTFFEAIAFQYNYSQTRPLIITFGGCKMWDESWRYTEHIDFTDKPFIDGDTQNWWSLKYNMTLDEMNRINDKYSFDKKVLVLDPPKMKFNGCGLVLSKSLLQTGVNIPIEIFFVHEDTSMLYEIQKHIPNAMQVVYQSCLLVHNRKHPLKRTGIQGEEHINAPDVGAKRKTQPWYDLANQYSQRNIWIMNDPVLAEKGDYYSWDDVWNEINKTK